MNYVAADDWRAFEAVLGLRGQVLVDQENASPGHPHAKVGEDGYLTLVAEVTGYFAIGCILYMQFGRSAR